MTRNRLTHSVYTLLQWTWGLPQTIAGAGIYLKHRNDPHFSYKGARVTAWNRDEGLSLGKFIFVPGNKVKKGNGESEELRVNGYILDHEYGHTIQSLILGPLYLILVGAPSFAWNRLPYFERRRRKTGRSYYSAVFERTANTFGERIAGKSRSGGSRD